MSEIVNEFHIIKICNEQSKRETGLVKGQFFGSAPDFSLNKWPKRDGSFAHHLLTVDLHKLENSYHNNLAGMHIFWFSNVDDWGDAGQVFTVIPIQDKIRLRNGHSVYPDGYEPWWAGNTDTDIYEKGVSVSLEKSLDLSLDSILKVIKGTSSFEELNLDRPDKKKLISNCYIGGFPVWEQGDEYPNSKGGNKMNFILCLNGTSEILEDTRFNYFTIYLFVDDKMDFKWIVQM